VWTAGLGGFAASQSSPRTALPADVIDAQIPRDSADPSPESLTVAELLDPGKTLKQCLLGHILCIFSVSDHSETNPENPPRVHSDKTGVCSLVRSATTLD
jgi:hypothetical protein